MNYVTAFLCGCGEVWELGYQEQCLFFVLVHKGERVQRWKTGLI